MARRCRDIRLASSRAEVKTLRSAGSAGDAFHRRCIGHAAVRRRKRGHLATLRWQRCPCTRDKAKRAILKWCGRLTCHLPVCNWLRPACSYIKHLVVMEADWDEPVSDQVAEFCRQLDAGVTGDGDPARGSWQVPSDKDVEYVIWCDALDIGLGVVVEVDGHVIEDR